VRVVLADDAAVLRDGLARVLAGAGIDVVAQVGTADELLTVVEAQRPDMAVVDIRMPPTQTDEGLVAAEQIGERPASACCSCRSTSRRRTRSGSSRAGRNESVTC
jgi:DNA-binding NarL/FixJ family response regulator